MKTMQPRPVSTFSLIVRHEARILVRDRTLPLVCCVLALMVGYGLFVGLAQATLRDRMVAQVLKHEQETQTANTGTLQSVLAGKTALIPFSNPANPAAMAGTLSGRYATMSNAPLAALAIGQSDMMPNYYRISYLSKVQFMYDTEIENPWNLLSGHFDLAFVIVFVLPLLVTTLGYNLLSAEREHGTLRMLCSQPLSIATLLTGKIVVRALALLAVVIPLPLVVLLLIRPEARGAEQLVLILSWSALVASYALFWFAVAALVNATGLTSSTNALIMVALWTIFVLILPVTMNLVVGLISPAPSRTELASRTRVATAESLREYQDLYSADYRYASDPEALLVKDERIEVPSRMRAFFLAKQRVDEQIEPILKRFDHQLLQQQKLVDRLSLLSPAILVNEALNSVAGTDSRRFLAFKDQTEAFHNKWRQYFSPRILESRAMTVQDLSSLPQWRWIEIPESETKWSIWWRTRLMLTLAFMLGGLALARSSRGSAGV
jgi:ABC-2 type transport system permease protein